MKPPIPKTMTPEMTARVGSLPEALRVAVLDRSAIIQEATGCTWAVADERALADNGLAVQLTIAGPA